MFLLAYCNDYPSSLYLALEFSNTQQNIKNTISELREHKMKQNKK